MKKIEFYTLINNGNGPEPVKVSGYTDGNFNYYKNAFGVWCAIFPSHGVSVADARTRKEVQQIANSCEMKKKIEKYLSIKNPWNKKLEKYLKAMEKAA